MEVITAESTLELNKSELESELESKPDISKPDKSELEDDEFDTLDMRQKETLQSLSKKDLSNEVINKDQLCDLIYYIYNITELKYVYITRYTINPDNSKIKNINFHYNEERNQYTKTKNYKGPIYYKLHYYHSMIDHTKIMFPEKYKVVLYNSSGFNDDVRGSDLTDIKLDYCAIYVLPNNTYKSLCDGLYRIKSHKFDKWYELYIRARIKIDDTANTINISVAFDHGS